MDPILLILEKNARETPEKIAQMLGLKTEEVQKRIARFEQDGILMGYRAVINSSLLPADLVRAVIEVRISPEREGGFDRTAERISKFDEVKSCYLMSGGYDVLIVVEGKSLQEVASFVASKLSTLERVQSTATHFILKPYKESGIPMAIPAREERMSVSP